MSVKQKNELLEQRAKLIADARTIVDRAEGEKRSMSAEESANYEKAMADAEQLRSRIEALNKLIEAERDLEQRESDRQQAEHKGEDSDTRTRRREASTEYRAAFDKFLRSGHGALSADEVRALSSDIAAEGGAIVLPQVMAQTLIKTVDNDVWVRQLATTMMVENADSLGIPSLDADPEDGTWTSEVAEADEDTEMKFGKRELKPNRLAKLLKLSRTLLRKVPAVEALVVERMAYKFAVTHEKAFMTGDGVGKPLGVFTASTNGIPTSRDVATGNTTTAITADGLIHALYSLKEGYRRNAVWGFHRDALSNISRLKDDSGGSAGVGSYIFSPATQADNVDRLLGRPVRSSEYIPNTFTTGLYVGILGDFSYYWIADSIAMEMQRLVELYARNGQVGMLAHWDTDGMPTLGEAFTRVKLA